MSKIPENEIRQLKEKVLISDLAALRGVVLRRHGEELIGLCPFHDDKKPSLVINTKKNLWNCLGACQSGGSVIDWVMRDKGCGFRGAVDWLVSSSQAAKLRLNKAKDYIPTGKMIYITIQHLPFCEA